MIQAEKLNLLKKYFKAGIKRLLKNPESAFEKCMNVQDAIFKYMPKEATKLLKEVNLQFGQTVINEVMTATMTEMLVEDPMTMANLLKCIVDHTAKLELNGADRKRTQLKFRGLIKETAEKTGESGSKIVLGLDYREDLEYRIKQLEKILIEE